MSPRPRQIIAATAAAAIALLPAACGGDDVDAGPAAAVPEAAPIYAEAVLKPDEETRDELSSSLGPLLGDEDPWTRVTAALDGLLDGDDVSWSEDVEPWAGERTGIFFLDFGGENGAVVVEVEDEDAAGDAVERLVGDGGATTEAEHAGVSYRLSEGDEAGGIVGDFAVMGAEDALQAAIEAEDGDSLGDSESYREAIEPTDEDRLLSIYLEPEATLDSLAERGQLEAAERERIAAELGDAAREPAVLTAGATAETLFAELASTEGSPIPSASELFERAPEEAWLAFGLGDAGAAFEAVLAVGGEELGAEVNRARGSVGLDLPQLAAASDDLGGYFGGTSIFGITGALLVSEAEGEDLASVLEGLEQGLARQPDLTVEPLATDGEGFTLAPAGAPIELPFVIRDGVLAAAIGSAGLDQAFDPESSLADADGFQRARDGLGEDLDPVAFLDFAQMLQLVRAIPGLESEPDLAAAMPYLERLEHFLAGVRTEDGRTLLRMVLAVRGGGSEE